MVIQREQEAKSRNLALKCYRSLRAGGPLLIHPKANVPAFGRALISESALTRIIVWLFREDCSKIALGVIIYFVLENLT